MVTLKQWSMSRWRGICEFFWSNYPDECCGVSSCQYRSLWIVQALSVGLQSWRNDKPEWVCGSSSQNIQRRDRGKL